MKIINVVKSDTDCFEARRQSIKVTSWHNG